MKTKQKSVRVFEIECENIAEFGAYLDKNGVLIGGLLIMLKNDTNGLFAAECKRRGLCYASMGECEESGLLAKKDLPPLEAPSVAPKKEEPLPIVEEPKKPAVAAKKAPIKPQAELPMEAVKEEKTKSEPAKTVLVTKNLRSGEFVSSDTDVTVLGRINSGAKVKTLGNAAIFDTVDGDVEVGGEYLMIRAIGKGNVSFKGEQIKKEMLDGKKTKMITFEGGKLAVKDI